MKQNNVLILIGIICILLAVFFSFNDNLTELSPLFLIGGVASFGWLMYRKTWTKDEDATAKLPATTLSKMSGLAAIAGILCLGIGGLGLFSDALEELLAAAIPGVLLLVLALVLRIINGMRTSRVDTTTGVLSISTITVLLGAIVVIVLGIFVVYSILSGLTLI